MVGFGCVLLSVDRVPIYSGGLRVEKRQQVTSKRIIRWLTIWLQYFKMGLPMAIPATTLTHQTCCPFDNSSNTACIHRVSIGTYSVLVIAIAKVKVAEGERVSHHKLFINPIRSIFAAIDKNRGIL